MNTPRLALALCATVPAAATPLPLIDAFKESTLAMPSLTLAGTAPALAPSAMPGPANDGFAKRFGRKPPGPSGQASVRGTITAVDNMPVLHPDPTIDYKLIVKEVDPKMDPKIIVPTGAGEQK